MTIIQYYKDGQGKAIEMRSVAFEIEMKIFPAVGVPLLETIIDISVTVISSLTVGIPLRS